MSGNEWLIKKQVLSRLLQIVNQRISWWKICILCTKELKSRQIINYIRYFLVNTNCNGLKKLDRFLMDKRFLKSRKVPIKGIFAINLDFLKKFIRKFVGFWTLKFCLLCSADISCEKWRLFCYFQERYIKQFISVWPFVPFPQNI